MKAFVKEHFEDFVNKRNAAVIRKNMTPDFYDHDGPGGKPTGVEGDEQMMVAMYKAMPDLRVTVEDMIAEGDKVMCRNVWRWTDPATGSKMQFRGFVLWRFEGSKIAERWATVAPPAKERRESAGRSAARRWNQREQACAGGRNRVLPLQGRGQRPGQGQERN